MNSADDVLKSVLKLLENEIQPLTIEIWFADAKAVELRQDCFIIRTDTPYKKEIIQTRYADKVKKVLEQIFSAPMDFIVIDGTEPVPADTSVKPEIKSANIETQYTFEDFVVGASNRFAHAAALGVARFPAQAYNPLFIYGESGLGKTHLMRAIANKIRQDFPSYKVLYVHTEDFVSEFVAAVKNNQTDEFRAKYNVADVLLVDDIQFITGKEQTQIEFFNTFNVLYENHKQICLTSDRPPREIYTLEKRLLSRFEMGLLVDISAPDYETRLAILKQKCEMLDLEVSDTLLAAIGGVMVVNIRQLEGIITHINADQKLSGGKVDIDMVRRAIRDVNTVSNEKPTASDIITEVCSFYGITPTRLKTKGQSKDIVLPRQIASYLMQQLADMTLADIGKVLGDQHYTTVINSIRTVEKKMKESAELASTVKDMMNNINEKTGN